MNNHIRWSWTSKSPVPIVLVIVDLLSCKIFLVCEKGIGQLTSSDATLQLSASFQPYTFVHTCNLGVS